MEMGGPFIEKAKWIATSKKDNMAQRKRLGISMYSVSFAFFALSGAELSSNK